MYNNRSICFFIVLLISIFNLKAEWTLQNPSITPQQLRCIYFINSSTGWIGGSAGGIFKTMDSGKTWVQQKTPKNNWVHSIHFTDENHGWAVGSYCVLHTDNGGVDWKEKTIDLITPRVASKVYFKNPAQGFILIRSPLNNVATTQDSGNTWQFQAVGNGMLYDMQFTDDNHAFLCGETYLGRSLDGGTTWIAADTFPHELERMTELHMLDSSNGYAMGNFGVCKTIDGGKTWSRILVIPVDVVLNFAGYFPNANEGFCMYGYEQMAIFRTTNGGLTWDTITEPRLSQINALTFPGKARGIAIGEDGAVYSFNHACDTIEKISKGIVSDIKSIDFYDSLHGFCDNGLYTMDGGRTWALKALPFTPTIVFDSMTIFSRNTRDSTMYSTDAGVMWDKSLIEPLGINQIQKIPGSKYGAFFLYPNNIIVMTKDAGKTYSTCSPVNFRYGQGFFINENRGWFVGQKAASTIDGGKNWNIIAESLPVDTSTFRLKTVFFVDTLHGWVGGYTLEMSSGPSIYERVILKTIDGGKTWARQINIIARGDFSTNPAHGTQTYGILKIRSRDGNRVWALDKVSGVLFSEDGGEHWEEQYLPCNNQRFSDMYFYDDNNIWVTANNSGIWKFTGNYTLATKEQKNLHSIIPSGKVYVSNSKLIISVPVLGLMQVTLFDLSGRVIRVFPINKTSTKFQIDLEKIVSQGGIYFLKLNSGGTSMICKITKL